MRCPNFKSLRRALTAGDFRPKLVALPGRLAPIERPLPPPATPYLQASATPQPATGTNPTPQVQSRIIQAQEQNYHPTPQMKIGPRFRI